MRGGQLRHRVTLTDRGEQATARGGFVQAPVIVATRIPAMVSDLNGVELVRAQQIDPRSRYSVSIRYRNDVTARLQVTYHARSGDRQLDIVNVTDTDEMHRELVLLCRGAA